MGMRVLSCGSYLPETVLTNADLEQMVETSDEWITERTGIKERRISAEMGTAQMGHQAAAQALQRAELAPEDIDLIVVTTVTPDNFTPSVSCMIQGLLGCKNAVAFDVNAACTGFVFAVDIADSFVRAGKAKNVLIVCTERLSGITDYRDRSTCVLFGDGAAALVLSSDDSCNYPISNCQCQGDKGDVLLAPALRGNNMHGDGAPVDSFLSMNGREVFRFAVSNIPKAIDRVLAQAELTIDDIDRLVPHQANLRIIDSFSRRYGLDPSRIAIDLDRYGNTSSASIPLCICEEVEQGRIRPGDKVLAVGFGGGLTVGATILQF